MWLAAVLHITKEFFVANQVPETDLERMLDDMLINFADSDRMKAMYAHTDTAIRFASRCICALLAKRLLQNRWFFVAELRWLEAVTEVSRYEIPGSLDNHMILEFLVCGIFPYQGVDIRNQGSNIPLPHQEGDVLHQAGDILAAHVPDFAETLAILMDAGTRTLFYRLTFTGGLSDLVCRLEAGDLRTQFVADKLCRIFPDFILP